MDRTHLEKPLADLPSRLWCTSSDVVTKYLDIHCDRKHSGTRRVSAKVSFGDRDIIEISPRHRQRQERQVHHFHPDGQTKGT